MGRVRVATSRGVEGAVASLSSTCASNTGLGSGSVLAATDEGSTVLLRVEGRAMRWVHELSFSTLHLRLVLLSPLLAAGATTMWQALCGAGGRKPRPCARGATAKHRQL